MPELPGVTHAFVTLSTGLRMHVAEAGNPDAPTVLLLHGFPQHWWEWRKVIPPLAERYRVVAPDLRGAGWTDAPADGYTVGDILADVLALLDALGLRRVGLVAHDFSAFIGFRLCFDHPERVAAFLCLGPHPYLRVKPQMLAGIPQLWFQPVVATPGLGPWALRTDRLARRCWPFTTTPDAITDEDLAVSPGASRRRGTLRPARRCTGTSSSRRWALPWPRRRTARGGSPSRPSRSWAALMPAFGRACSMSAAVERTTSPATSSMARHISSPMIVPTPS